MHRVTDPKQPTNLLSHWYAFTEGVQFSAVDFYDSIEEELNARKVPRLRSLRISFHEGSALSDKRLYLRLMRERFAFEACAAPFGTGFFFSLRFVEVPRGGWIQLLLLAVVIFGVGYSSLGLFRYAFYEASLWFWVTVCVIALSGIGVSAVRQSRRKEKFVGTAEKRPRILPDFDALFLSLPVVGEWYERNRMETYYRYDTRVVFHSLVSEIVKRKVSDVTAAKGVRLLRTYEYNPIFGDLYKTVAGQPSPVHSENVTNRTEAD